MDKLLGVLWAWKAHLMGSESMPNIPPVSEERAGAAELCSCVSLGALGCGAGQDRAVDVNCAAVSFAPSLKTRGIEDSREGNYSCFLVGGEGNYFVAEELGWSTSSVCACLSLLSALCCWKNAGSCLPIAALKA